MIEAITQYVQNLPEHMQYLYTFLISAVPIIELRAAIPFGIGLGLNWFWVYVLSVIGNMLPVPFIILFARTIINYLKKTRILGWFGHWLEKHSEKKKDKVLKYEKIGLFIFVMIPLPGTGGWTGALIASLLDLRLKNAFWPILLGVMTAGVIVTLLSMGIFSFI